jgi:hypothetical protein
MDLGDIYLKAAASICIAAGALTVVVVLLLRRRKKISWPGLLALAAPLLLLLCGGGLYFGHPPLFAAWHRAQNDMLPKTGCLTYEPSFARLYASYRMSRSEFDAWVQAHPWELKRFGDSDISDRDLQHFGAKKADVRLMTPPVLDGKQLRVYYHDNVMYVAYFSM